MLLVRPQSFTSSNLERLYHQFQPLDSMCKQSSSKRSNSPFGMSEGKIKLDNSGNTTIKTLRPLFMLQTHQTKKEQKLLENNFKKCYLKMSLRMLFSLFSPTSKIWELWVFHKLFRNSAYTLLEAENGIFKELVL